MATVDRSDVWARWPDDFMCPIGEVEQYLNPPCARSDDYERVEVFAYDASGSPTLWARPGVRSLPIFTLTGEDRHAAVLVNLWSLLTAAEGNLEDSGAAAYTANEMVEHLQRTQPGVIPTGVRGAIEALVLLAQEAGCVVTVDQVPLQPLAMGHYQHRVAVRPARTRT